jgi:hypothetical protein
MKKYILGYGLLCGVIFLFIHADQHAINHPFCVAVDLRPFSNAVSMNPWPSNPQNGYESWFEGPIAVETVLLEPHRSGDVLVLGPGESIDIPVDSPYKSKSLVFLCSSMSEQPEMKFTVEVKSKDGVSTETASAVNWQRRDSHGGVELPIRVSGANLSLPGVVGYSSVAVPHTKIRAIRIINNYAGAESYLMIAAISTVNTSRAFWRKPASLQHTIQSHLRSEPVFIKDVCNRVVDSPWPNQPPYGYRQWLPEFFEYKDVLFQSFPTKDVISIAPGQSVTIELPKEIFIGQVAFLCSVNYAYKSSIPFEVQVRGKGGSSTVFAYAKDWYQAVSPQISLPIFVDEANQSGNVTFSMTKPINRIAREIAITNSKAKLQQYLLIGAISTITYDHDAGLEE